MTEERRRRPFDPEDTDWGQKMERRHTDNLARFLKIEGELGKIDEHIKNDIKESAAMRVEMNTNTAITQSVKDDTAPLRVTGIRLNRMADEWFGTPETSPGAKDGQDGVGKQITKLLDLRRFVLLAISIGVALTLAMPGIVMMWDRAHGR